MASGYEKHACGVDPNEGWGKPSRLDRTLSIAYIATGLMIAGLVILRLVRIFT